MQLICYLSNGFPTIEKSAALAATYAAAGCNIIEIDLPARDPFLEGDYIAGRMAEALRLNDDYQSYMDNITRIASSHASVKIILLAYESTVKEIGTRRFIKYCADNNFLDVILVGLEGEAVKNQLITSGIRVCCYVQRRMDPVEIESARTANGFVYLQAKSTEANPDFPTLADCVGRLRSLGINRPIYCGVGIATPQDYLMVHDAGADGAFVGGTILKLYDQPAELASTIRAFRRALPH